ncbi:MAG: hypothetical protein PWQ82_1857 [Thermosediminibacterales bacterium]|nr:hypothetical protein [Thermosediminibacterales bacterium]
MVLYFFGVAFNFTMSHNVIKNKKEQFLQLYYLRIYQRFKFCIIVDKLLKAMK